MGKKFIPELVKHQGEKYVRIDPLHIDLSKMDRVQKVKSVIALEIDDEFKLITTHGEFIETKNYGQKGDFLVFNIGESESFDVENQILNCEIKIIKKNIFYKLYSEAKEKIKFISSTKEKIINLLKLSNNDEDTDFSDYSFVDSASKHEYIGKEVNVVNVPYNFVVKAPWGYDQFIKKGGYIIYNPHVSSKKYIEIYGIEGAREKTPGQFEKTYSLSGELNGQKLNNKGEVIKDHMPLVIKADRSPIAGIQFNNRDLATAYERVGKEITSHLEKFI